MYYNFSNRTEAAVDYASKIAAKTGGLIATEHLLAGVLATDKQIAARAEASGITLSGVVCKIEVVRNFDGGIKITQNATVVLDGAQELADRFSGGVIDPIHIFLSILRTPCRARSIIMSFNVNASLLFDELRREFFVDKRAQQEDKNDDLFADLKNLYQKMASGMGEREEEDYRMGKPQNGRNDKVEEALKGMGEDLTRKAKQDKLDPVIGRKNEIERIIQILSRRTKNNPVLIGEPGVGK
ncbi:MAG TPA: hypothetical protein DHV31_02815, partial [Clostridiales bacterium]|nr:hypothetical protein [Clostridiales bacterium]